ncbi:MAG: hypothetical protein Q8876_06495 [Bacillota bacterium]|nr:hypothetical protein [Bacillota bacterium]
MKKHKKIILTILVLFAIFSIASATIYSYKPLYYKIYPFDRIKGTVSITINGKPATIDSNSFTCSRDSKEHVSVSSNDDGSINFSTKGGSYGIYFFKLLLNNNSISKELPAKIIYFNYYNRFWYNVANVDIHFDIKKKSDKWITKTTEKDTVLNQNTFKTYTENLSSTDDLSSLQQNTP